MSEINKISKKVDTQLSFHGLLWNSTFYFVFLGCLELWNYFTSYSCIIFLTLELQHIEIDLIQGLLQNNKNTKISNIFTYVTAYSGHLFYKVTQSES